MGFQIWLKRWEWRQMPDREGKRVPDHWPDVLKGSLPQGPPVHPRDTEYSGIGGWVKRARRRAEEKQRSEVWRRSCTRDNVETDESYFVLNPAADSQSIAWSLRMSHRSNRDHWKRGGHRGQCTETATMQMTKSLYSLSLILHTPFSRLISWNAVT